MALDFTVAIVPDTTQFDRELLYIKSALLYADKINLISPLAYIFDMITKNSSKKDEKSMIKLWQNILPLINEIDPETYNQGMFVTKQLITLIKQKKYYNLPLIQRINFRKQIIDSLNQMSNKLYDIIGVEECADLQELIDNNQVNILKFEHGFNSSFSIVVDYCRLLSKAVKNSYPLFDEISNDIMKQAINSKIITLSPTEQEKITHAGLVNNYMQRLPSFEEATMAELIDIKTELENPLIRFRGKMHKYSETIKTAPWDEDFEQDCNILFHKEVAPALLELEEATKGNSFRKNLGKKFFTEEGLWKSCGGLVVSIAASGVISSFNKAISDEQALAGSAIAATAFTVTRVISAYNDYKEKNQEIINNDLYFYYKANQIMNKKHSK